MEFVPAASAVVVQVAMLVSIETDPQPVRAVPPLLKATVPAAPAVTVAVRVIDSPTIKEVTEDARLTVDALPGITGTRGVERSL